MTIKAPSLLEEKKETLISIYEDNSLKFNNYTKIKKCQICSLKYNKIQTVCKATFRNLNYDSNCFYIQIVKGKKINIEL